MALQPDKRQTMYSQINVDTGIGNRVRSAYDLALYPEFGNPRRGVLVVTVILSAKFLSGVSKRPGTAGRQLTWSPAEKTAFMAGYKEAVGAQWGEKWRISTPSKVPAFKEVGVVLDIQMTEEAETAVHHHWNAQVTKVDEDATSQTTREGGSILSGGEIRLDSLDLSARTRGGEKQRAVVHEFGHILGYRDEYPDAEDRNDSFPDDLKSVMFYGEGVRERHYVYFAEWLRQQFALLVFNARQAIPWLVNGRVDKNNAKL
jgi:hypothetical protein